MGLKQMEVQLDFFADMFKLSHNKEFTKIIADALPEDAKVVDCRITSPNSIRLLISSSEFENSGNGRGLENLPQIQPTMQRFQLCD